MLVRVEMPGAAVELDAVLTAAKFDGAENALVMDITCDRFPVGTMVLCMGPMELQQHGLKLVNYLRPVKPEPPLDAVPDVPVVPPLPRNLSIPISDLGPLVEQLTDVRASCSDFLARLYGPEFNERGFAIHTITGEQFEVVAAHCRLLKKELDAISAANRPAVTFSQ